MRMIALAVVFSALAGSAGYALLTGNANIAGTPTRKSAGPDTARAGANTEANADADDRSAEGATTAVDATTSERDSAPTKSIVYQWVDERGSVHFAGSLDQVSIDWRSRAGQIELDRAVLTTAPSASDAKPRRPTGAVAYVPASATHDLTIYTAPWCGWCRKTIEFLDERGVDYVNKDIEADQSHAAELQEKSGGTAVPLVEIDGERIRGFDPDGMTALLDQPEPLVHHPSSARYRRAWARSSTCRSRRCFTRARST